MNLEGTYRKPPRPSAGVHLNAVERWTMILAALAIAAAAAATSRSTAFGVTVGAGLMVANAMVLRRVGQRVLRSLKRPGIAVLLLNLKMAVLIGLVLLIIKYLHVDTLGFLIGVSVFPLAVLVAAIQTGLAESDADPTPLETVD
ncbi:MAG: hypothetical protein EXR72_03505 [Myxococcales bacterium]|nr:hypothetical protein [Myxococcales bacterium]